LLAGSSVPNLTAHFRFMVSQGVRHLVCLSSGTKDGAEKACLQWFAIKMRDFAPPTFDQAVAFCEYVDKAVAAGEPVVVHCAWGRGRTGTMLACYRMYSQGITAEEAIAEIRTLRPGSIESSQQLAFVSEWGKHLSTACSQRSKKKKKAKAKSEPKHPKIPEAPPPNFSWVVARSLAGSGSPSISAHFRFMAEQGARHLVCLSSDTREGAEEVGLKWFTVELEDFCHPSIEQVTIFCDYVDTALASDEPVVVHCTQGQGRTGTMLACYLVHSRGVTPEEAITEIRTLRPGSIEMSTQVAAVSSWGEHLCKKRERA